MELDLICTDNVTNQKIVVEAKAHQDPINLPDLVKFYGKFTSLQNKVKMGVFWSLSGINSHAEAWYRELSARKKQVFQIKSGSEFYDLLLKSKLVVSRDTIASKLSELVQEEILAQELVYYANSWYYIQLLGTENADRVVIFGGSGEFVDNFTSHELRKHHSRLKHLTLILLESRMEILKILLSDEQITMNEIAKKLKIKRVDIQTTINSLVEQNLLEVIDTNNKKFKIKRGLATFLKISNEFKQESSIFMRSSYFKSSINSELMNFITNRFIIILSKQQLGSIQKLIAISPSALEHCLRSDDVPDQNSDDDPGTNPAKNKFRILDLFSSLCVLTLSDMEQRRVLQLDVMNAVMAKIHLKFATPDSLYLDIQTKYNVVVMKVSGSIKRGELVRPASPEGLITWASLYHNLGQTGKAERMLEDMLVHQTNNPSWSKAACINLGLYKTKLNKLEDAKFWLLRATREYPDALEGWLNLGNVYLKMGKIVCAKKIFMNELAKKPANLKLQYGLAKVLVQQGNVNQCVSILEKILVKERGFIKLINSDKEFKEFKQSDRYKELIGKVTDRPHEAK